MLKWRRLTDPKTKKRLPLALKSDATNAYDLLKDVCKCILDEPTRYYQADWIITSDYEIDGILGDRKPPPCGTMACVGGWTALLASRKSPSYHVVHEVAKHLLGVQQPSTAFSNELDRLFSGDALLGKRPGTKQYAKTGVKRIKTFMRKYEKRLKGTPLPPL